MKFGSNLDIVWREDPKLLGIRMARYKFVSKMLIGAHRVIEVGAGDGFLSRIVSKEVNYLSLYDKEPQGPEVVKMNFEGDDWHPELHGVMNAAYALDVLEHVKYEDRFMETICKALTRHGTCIIGMPSLESQIYASPHSKAGHVNCKTENQLRTLMLRYFYCVYMFGMNDEVVHTGFGPMCHYRLAVCNTKRHEV